jgi:hypothetical protein
MLEALAVLAALGFVALIALSVYVVVEAYYYQGRLAEDLRRELGFAHCTPYVRCGRWTHDVLTVTDVDPYGVFARAGFRDGDVIVGPSISGLYKLLHCGRGSKVRLKVVEGGDGPPLSKRPRREIIVRVPATSESP